MTRNAPPLTTPTEDEPFTFSASGISTARGCMRKAAYRYVLGLTTPANASAALGSKIHKEMEDWFVEKRVPMLAPTKRLLPLAPNPTHDGVLVEHPFRLLLPVGVARGFIDLVVPRPDPKRMPAGDWSPDRPAVFDWKSTSNLAYAKTETDLLKDPQAVLYGVAARLVIAPKVSAVPEVDLQWTYTTTRGADSRPVRVRQTLTILEDGLAEVIATAEEMAKTFAEAAPFGSVDGTPYDLRECDKYGGCPHREACTAAQAFVSTGRGPDLVPRLDAPTEAPTVRPLPERNAPMADSALLARLRAGAKTPPKVQPPPETAADSVVAAASPPDPDAVKPSPEPGLPSVDTSGLDEPIPPGTAPINSPQAQPNVSPEDPPAPPPAAKPRGRPKGSITRPDPSAFAPIPDGVGDLEATLTYFAQKALAEGDPARAVNLATVLTYLR